MQIEHPHENHRLRALADALENQRILASWAEIRAEALRRERMQIDCVRVRVEDLDT